MTDKDDMKRKITKAADKKHELQSPGDYTAFYKTWMSLFRDDPERDMHYEAIVLNLQEDLKDGNIIQGSREHRELQNFYAEMISNKPLNYGREIK